MAITEQDTWHLQASETVEYVLYHNDVAWTKHQKYPPGFSSKPTGSDSSKRSKSSSYSQSVRDGDVEKAYTPAWETQLSSKGLNMDLENGKELVSKWSRNFLLNS